MHLAWVLFCSAVVLASPEEGPPSQQGCPMRPCQKVGQVAGLSQGSLGEEVSHLQQPNKQLKS